jgi:hypothetical protein
MVGLQGYATRRRHAGGITATPAYKLAVVAALLGKDEMQYLKTEDSFEGTIRELILNDALDMWRNEMKVAVANGIGAAFGGR